MDLHRFGFLGYLYMVVYIENLKQWRLSLLGAQKDAALFGWSSSEHKRGEIHRNKKRRQRRNEKDLCKS